MVAGNTITNWTLGLALPAAAARAVLAAQARALGCAVVTFAEAADLLAAPVWPQALLVDETFLTARDGGAELLAALQTRSPACASILLTGTERRWTAAALRAGAHAYLVKPIAPAEFQAVLARLLAEQAQRQAASSEQEVFASLLASSAELHGALDEQETLLRILTGIQRLGFERVRLLRLSDDGRELLGKAQVGMSGDFRQVRWGVDEDEYWQQLRDDPRPRVCVYELGMPTHAERGLGKDGVAQWLCVPLLWQNKLLGQICADNKYSGRPIEPRDWQPLALFGLQAAAALKEHELLAELQRAHARHELMIEKLPLAAVSIDRRGNVQTFNQRAADIFGYSAAEARGLKVHKLHADADEPARIGRLLAERGGQLADYECNVVSRDGQVIPISLSAHRHYDERGVWDWGVGYFEDRRLSQRLGVLLRASNILVTATSLAEGLRELAREMAALFPQAFCRVLLYDEQRQTLTIRAAAACQLSDAPPAPDWEPGIGQSFHVDDYPGLAALLARGLPRLLSKEDPALQPNLRKLARQLKLKSDLRALLLAPLVRGTKVIGLLAVGEAEHTAASQLTLEARELVEAVAAQITLLIERWQAQETERQRLAQAELLYQLARFVQEANDEAPVLHALLTSVTASYGLRFNRALVLMLDESGQCLSGRLGIGQTDKAAAQHIWENLAAETLADFQSYLARLRTDGVPRTELAAVARRLDFERDDPRAAWLFAALAGHAEHVLKEEEYAVLPPKLLAELQPGAELAVTPLVAHQRAIGLLLADNKFNRAPIRPAELPLLRSFANTAAAAVAHTQLLNRFYTASDRFDAGQQPRQLQAQIVREIKAASGASAVVLIDADEQGKFLSRLAYPDGYFDPAWRLPRQHGISREVLTTGRARTVADVDKARHRLHPLTPLETRAMACLPLSLPDKRLGVVWPGIPGQSAPQ